MNLLSVSMVVSILVFAVQATSHAESAKDNDISLRTARELVSVLPELISRVPVDKLQEYGTKALEFTRSWPALTSWAVGPSTGTIVGVIALAIFIITIWIIIYSVGVVPVGGYLLGRNDNYDPYPMPGLYRPYPYNQRIQRSLNEMSKTVMNSIDKWSNEKLNK